MSIFPIVLIFVLSTSDESYNAGYNCVRDIVNNKYQVIKIVPKEEAAPMPPNYKKWNEIAKKLETFCPKELPKIPNMLPEVPKVEPKVEPKVVADTPKDVIYVYTAENCSACNKMKNEATDGRIKWIYILPPEIKQIPTTIYKGKSYIGYWNKKVWEEWVNDIDKKNKKKN